MACGGMTKTERYPAQMIMKSLLAEEELLDFEDNGVQDAQDGEDSSNDGAELREEMQKRHTHA